MASSKSYKNVYTILEKVKKGEIESHYKKGDSGLFGKVNFYKKPDLVTPNLHYLDEHRIDAIMNAHVNNKDDFKSSFEKFRHSNAYRKIPDGSKPDYNKFYQEISDIYKTKFPKHLARDIFKMYYNKIEKLDFEDRDEKNHTKFKFLERSNNPVGKIMSENSQLKSAVFMKNIVGYYLTQLALLKFQDEEAANDMMKNLKEGGDEFSNDKVQKAMDDMLDNKTAKEMLEEAINDAQDTCKSLDSAMSEEQQDQMFENASKGSDEAGKIDGQFLNRIAKDIQKIKLSLGNLKEKIKKLMDKSASYFSAKEETTFDDLFNSDNIGGLDDFMLLHPSLRKIMIEDVMIKDTKKVGKIDLYIDISGSMASSCGIRNSDGSDISKLDFCKSFAYKLKEMDMLNDIYTFENVVRKINSDLVSIAMIDDRGGTDIDKAVNKVVKNGLNAIIITDAEDSCSVYSDKAFFIGVQGSRFTGFRDEVIREYSEKDQVIVFNGTTIQKVDKRGFTIK